MTAVIVDIRGKQAAALNESGQIIRIRNANYEIGQQIECYERRLKKTLHIAKRAGSIAAAAALAVMLGTGAAYAMPYGTVTVGGDSSITYTVNCFDYVLEVQAADETGKAVLAEIDTKNLCHRRIEKAVEVTVERMEQDGFWGEENAVLQISTSNINERHAEKLRQELEPVVIINSRPEALSDTEPPSLPIPEERSQPADGERSEIWSPENEMLTPGSMPEEDSQDLPTNPPAEDRADFPGSFPAENAIPPQGIPSPPEAVPFPDGNHPSPSEEMPLFASEEQPGFPEPPERNP